MLVAISIPIFTSQLEKSRDSVSISNIRAAYAEAASAVLTSNGKAVTVGNATTTAVANDKQTVTVTGVVTKGTVSGWSNMETELPFTFSLSADAGGTALTSGTATFEFDLKNDTCELKSLA